MRKLISKLTLTLVLSLSLSSQLVFAKGGENTTTGINPFTAEIEAAKAELIAKTPITVAVTPATGVETDFFRNDIRIAVHNSVSASEFELLKPADIDKKLESLTNGKPLSEFTNMDIAKHLGVDGLFLVELTKQDKVYAGAYASFTVGIKVQVYSLKHNSIIWTFESEEAEREGGVSANPLSIVATAITSTQVLKDSIRFRLIDVLVRNFANDIPKPNVSAVREKASVINFAYSNAINSPFTAGEKILIQMHGEEGMKTIIKITGSNITFPLTETEKGVYTGAYEITDQDNATNSVINVHAKQGTKDWTHLRIPGFLTISNATE